jgi:hypothetical protein
MLMMKAVDVNVVMYVVEYFPYDRDCTARSSIQKQREEI